AGVGDALRAPGVPRRLGARAGGCRVAVRALSAAPGGRAVEAQGSPGEQDRARRLGGAGGAGGGAAAGGGGGALGGTDEELAPGRLPGGGLRRGVSRRQDRGRPRRSRGE